MVNINIGPQAPAGTPQEMYQIIEDLHIAMFSLVHQLNQQQGIIQSPNGHYWRVNVGNTGAVTTTDLGTVLPP